MNGSHFLGFALSATAFGALAFWALIAYGGDVSRPVAIGGALCAAVSQFIGQDHRARVPSIFCAYLAILAGIVSLTFQAMGQ